MGWILAAVMTVIALIATGLLWAYHRRKTRRLRASHQDSVQRLGAEHQRRIQRLDREYDRELRSAHHPLAQDLLPALDSLDEAVAQLEDDDQPTSAQDLGEGLTLARNALYDALSRHDITPIRPGEGEPFDPEIHEAISRHETAEASPETVRQLFRTGYRDQHRILRAALVEVNVAPAQCSASSSDDDDADESSSSDDRSDSADQADVDSTPDPPNGRVDRT